MSLAPAPTSDLGLLLRRILDGDLTAATAALDCLKEQGERHDDWSWLRERVGALAVATFGDFFGDETTGNRRKKFLAEARWR